MMCIKSSPLSSPEISSKKRFTGLTILNITSCSNRRVCLVMICLLWLGVATNGISQTFDPNLDQQLTLALDDERISRNLTGISAAVIVPEQGLWAGVSGFSVPEDSISLHPDMLFGVASVTKTFTSALVLQLAEEGRLSLDDSLANWLPAFENIDSTITIRQLLNHTSGVYDYAFHPDIFIATFTNPFRYWQPEEILQEFIEAPVFEPGASWSYSNTNYILLGMIIKLATGTEIAGEFHQRFFEPLSLQETFFLPEDTLIGTVSHNWLDITGNGELNDLSGFPRTAIYSLAWAAGGIVSKPENIVRWSHALFSGDVLSPESMNEMLSFVDLNSSLFSGYGLGVMRYNLVGRDVWGHSGLVPGYRSAMYYSPQDDISIVVLINQNPAEPVSIVSTLLEVILQSDPTGIADVSDDPVSSEFTLFQNYPNPFNPETTIEYHLLSSAIVNLTVYNNLGERVRVLVKDHQPPGTNAVVWDGKDDFGNPVSSGVYFYNLGIVEPGQQPGNALQTRKMVLIR